MASVFAMFEAVAARRLPVIQTPSGEDADAAERPAWQWLLWGAVLIIVLFLPLSMVAVALGQKLAHLLARANALAAWVAPAPVLLAFAFAAWVAGAVIGRFGLRSTKRTAPAAGMVAALALVLFGMSRGESSVAVALIAVAVLFVLAGVGAAFAALGARFGRRRRK